MVKAQLDNEISMNYGLVSVGGVDIFAIEVAESDKKIWLEGKYFVYENNDVEEKVVNQNDRGVSGGIIFRLFKQEKSRIYKLF